ncbi:MAG: ABC transporter permease [Gemmatimonadota bacterium]|jgi:predicted permease
MKTVPPGLATRILEGVLRDDPAGPAILGDIHEDFVRACRTRGLWAGRLWYWREAFFFSAARAAHRTFGLTLGVLSMEGFIRLQGLGEDIHQAFRAIKRAPGFSFFTALIVGLGVGAAAGVFSVMKPLFVAPLPFEEPEALVWIANQTGPRATSLSAMTSRSGNLRDFRERARSFDGLTGYNAFSEQGAYTITGVGEPERLVGFAVAHDFLQVLGVRPLHGRSFTQEEGLYGGPRALILSYGFWVRRFAGDAGIVGTTITLNDEAWAVVGVLPPSFDFSSVFTPGTHVDFLLPYPVSDETDRHGNEVFILGRLGPGVTPQAAQAELDGIMAALQEEQPDRWGLEAHLSPLQEHIAGPFRSAFILLVAAAGTLILIVCVNVSNLLLARSPRRAGEMALRKALGASQGRIARQLILESLGTSLLGVLFGAGLAWVAVGAVAGTTGMRVPLLDQVQLDGSALLIGTGVALLTGLVVSLIPAVQIAEGDEASILREAGRGSSAGKGARRLRDGLVVAEVAMACTLLVVGGLLTRSFREVMDVELGFDPSNTVAWQIRPSQRFESLEEVETFYSALTRRVGEIPIVEEVGLIDALPLGRNRNWILRIPGVHGEGEPGVGFFPHLVGPGYLPSMKIPLAAGRNLSWDDGGEAPLVFLINESGAERLFPEGNPIGRKVAFGWAGDGEIVGVVRDVHHVSPELGPGVQIYFPLHQVADFRTLDMVVRSSVSVEETAAAVAAALREMDSQMPTREFWTVESTVERAVSARRFTLAILATYGAVALLLAGLGIYGVLSQTVAERRPEIGIRMALGASAGNVVRGVLVRTLALTLLGIAGGTVLSIWSARFLESLLFGVNSRDPATYGSMVLILLAVAVLAAALPAIRAAGVQGSRVLRAE